MLFDIAIGGAGSEQIIVPNIYIYGGGNGLSFHFWIPVWIPSGKRIAARMQGSDTLVNAFVTCYALSASMFGEFGFQIIDSLGTSTANSGGTAIDAGAVANTKGSYAQIIASTSAAYRGLIVMFGNNATNRSLVADYAVDIAIGAAASERVILPDLELKANGQDQVIPQVWGPFFFNIPSGVRLSARSSSTTTDAVERIIDVAILGLR
jgi:hypothetical protein